MSDNIGSVYLHLDRYAGGSIYANDPLAIENLEVKDYFMIDHEEYLHLYYNEDVYTRGAAVELLKKLYLDDMDDEEREKNNDFRVFI